MRLWRRRCIRYSCRPPSPFARSPPHWCAKSRPWAATYRPSCRHRSQPARRPSSRADTLVRDTALSCFHMTGVFMIRILALVAALFIVAPAIAQPLPANLDKANAIVIDTTKGRIVIKLRTDLAPQHAERIKLLAREGYYNNVPFHRVIEGFMAQTGDGKNFNGTGGSKYPNLAAEFSNVPFKRGIVGMARAASNDSANSQFFIMFAEGASLNGKYTVIGEVVSGMDVVDKIKRGEPVADPDKMVKVQVASDVK